ncbi:hypothetical protein NDU88_005088 [Pleurodeles waltl]|uniref:Uncharacterized protein n=1 Tax=Pleurodeles waltl TaxID=8319 RepID=A0AAV7RN43_PLEWA|nr:hypothetical protein NDU88_005088 [Pleurodeles waltl]
MVSGATERAAGDWDLHGACGPRAPCCGTSALCGKWAPLPRGEERCAAGSQTGELKAAAHGQDGKQRARPRSRPLVTGDSAVPVDLRSLAAAPRRCVGIGRRSREVRGGAPRRRQRAAPGLSRDQLGTAIAGRPHPSRDKSAEGWGPHRPPAWSRIRRLPAAARTLGSGSRMDATTRGARTPGSQGDQRVPAGGTTPRLGEEFARWSLGAEKTYRGRGVNGNSRLCVRVGDRCCWGRGPLLCFPPPPPPLGTTTPQLD